MPIVYLTVIFVSLILILSTLRIRLVYELSGTSLLAFGSTRPGILLYSLLVLPGTIIHELSHWLMAEILQVKTGEIIILPELRGQSESGSERLGSVATERSDPIRGFLIGLAPFITGMIILIVLARLLQVGWGVYPGWQLTLLIYGIMVTGNSMLISKEDRRTWPVVIILTILIALALNGAGIKLAVSNYDWLALTMRNLNLVLGVTAALNLGMIGGSYALRRLIERVTKKRIIHKKGADI